MPAAVGQQQPANLHSNRQNSMSYPASRKYSYLGQLGILAGLIGAGLVMGTLISTIPFLGKMNFGTAGSSKDLMDSLLVPENAGMLRLVQFISTLFIFFLPAYFYSKICHQKALTHLGMKKPVNVNQVVIVFFVVLASLPFVSMLGQLTEMLPFSEATLQKFKRAEEEYAKQVAVIGRMDHFFDFLISLVMLAILPAVFEETLFRGGLQNLLSRWIKLPVLAILITSLIFSAVHFSYLGFLSRVVLGFVLGWMYHRTGNLWLSIIAHITNNAIALTFLYVMKLNDPAADLNTMDPEFPLWIGVMSLVVLLAILYGFEKVNKHQVDKPGEEELMTTEESNPFG